MITPEGKSSSRFLERLWDSAGMLFVFVLLFIVLSLTVKDFFSPINMVGLALSVSSVGLVACTMLFCLASGHFDLSIEAIIAFSGVLTAVVISRTGSILEGVLLGILAGGVVGFLNGFIIAKLRINALITTLATLQIVRGLGFVVSDGKAVGITKSEFFLLGNSDLLGVPMPIWITTSCFVIFGIVLHKTAFGRATLAIGGNEEAARLAGIPVSRVKITIFTLQGLITGFAGVILAARMTSGQPNTSVGFSLDVISACVLGGVSLSGGVGTMLGTVVGILIMGTVQNAMNLMNIPTFYQYVVRGSILLIAVLFDQIKQRRGDLIASLRRSMTRPQSH